LANSGGHIEQVNVKYRDTEYSSITGPEGDGDVRRSIQQSSVNGG
jgi:hypothetical protein